MRNRVRLTAAASGLMAVSIALSGCSFGTTSSEHAGHATVTTVNGSVPPGEPTKVTSSETVLDITEDGTRHLVFRDVRPVGTRSPIHEHPYGGMTCMVAGEMTLYLEGSEPQTAGPGQCYWMPPGLPMSGVNSGTGDAILYDMFNVPAGQPVWQVVETGQEHLQGNFMSGNEASQSPSRLAEPASDGAWFSKDVEVCVQAGPTSRGIAVAPNTGTNYSLTAAGQEECRTAEFPGGTVRAMAGTTVVTFIYAAFNPPIGYPTLTITTGRGTSSHGFDVGEPWDVSNLPVHVERRADSDVKRFVITIG